MPDFDTQHFWGVSEPTREKEREREREREERER
jgi:hypothetical protein